MLGADEPERSYRAQVPLDKKTFFDNFKPWFKGATGKALSARRVKAIDFLLDKFQEDVYVRGGGVWSDPRNVAYVLATIHVETAFTYEPIVEKGAMSYFNKYDIEHNPKKAKELGNIYPGDGYLFRGRGYVQLTGRTNYEKFNISHAPDFALDADLAFSIMAWGMRDGDYTGKKLSDYINDKKTDYKGARRIINGQDRAQEIADYAKDIEQILRISAAASASQDPPAKESEKTSATPTPEAANLPAPQQQTILERVTSPLIAVKEKFDQLGVNPSSISKSSFVTTTFLKVQGLILMAYTFLSENPRYFWGAVALIIMGSVVFIFAKRNATARVIAER